METNSRPSLAELAAANKLRRVGARPDLGRYLWRTWLRRYFIWVMAVSRVQKSVEGNRLGVAWLVIKPLLDALVYGLIFGLIQGDSRGPDFVPRVIIGTCLFSYFGGCLSGGMKAIVGNRALVQALPFPRLTLVLATVAQELISGLLALVVVFVAMPLLGYMPGVDWLAIFPLMIIFTLFNTGVAMIAARLTVHVSDLTQIIPFITRILFFTSGVFFNVDRIFKSMPWLRDVYEFHPIYQVLELGRSYLMHTPHNNSSWIFLSTIAVATFALGLLFFWVAEERYGRD